MLGTPRLWTPGPNDKQGNIMESSGNDEADGEDDTSGWLWLSGGTDWQGFQGGFQCISTDGVKPSWLTFRVRIATPALSGAFLTFSAAQRTWGLEDIVFAFHYSGDERSRSHQQRCFLIQTGSTQQGHDSHPIRIQPEIVADQPYQVSIHFDWAAAEMSVFVDGVQYLSGIPFRAAHPVRFAAIYNWRSGARTAFSELMLGDACPYDISSSTFGRSQLRLAKRTYAACCKRRKDVHPAAPTPERIGSAIVAMTSLASTRLLASAAFGLAAAVCLQQLIAS